MGLRAISEIFSLIVIVAIAVATVGVFWLYISGTSHSYVPKTGKLLIMGAYGMYNSTSHCIDIYINLYADSSFPIRINNVTLQVANITIVPIIDHIQRILQPHQLVQVGTWACNESLTLPIREGVIIVEWSSAAPGGVNGTAAGRILINYA